MSPEASEKTEMVAEKPCKEAEEMLSKESLEKLDMMGQVTKTLGTEATQDRIKEVNGRRFTYRFRYKDGQFHHTYKDWFDEDGHSIEWWEKKSLLRDWIHGRMSPEEFDAHFPYYMGPPKELYRIKKEAHTTPQEEKEPSGLKESDELYTQRYADHYGDGSGLPLRPGMDPMTDEEAQKLVKDRQDISDRVHNVSPEEFPAQFLEYSESDTENPENPEDRHWNEEEVCWMVRDDTSRMLRDEHYDCLREEVLLKEDDEEKSRYASYYADSSGLPVQSGMGPPMTEEEFEESLKKWKAEGDRVYNLSQEEFYAEFPEWRDMPDYFLAEDEALGTMEECDEADAHRRGSDS
ncbi:hypothetical protein FACUT_3032 [Fusarium acutatum]|uniref:Uncharacterized protein n=1 Tax=Fusarium acutatum TaxID=78861 RepID=A0A8H4NQ07_9HYPO|nr:hypothetical protein FACUT_3032 [Fusarium acutatum]